MDSDTRKLLKRVAAARQFPNNTCGASRHAQMIGEALVKGQPWPMLAEDPGHCGGSILSVVASLYEARSKIAQLQATQTADHSRQGEKP
jgi:hypothetical protein